MLTVKEAGVASIWDITTDKQVGEIHPSSPLVARGGASLYGVKFRFCIESAALNNDGNLALLGLNDGTAGIFSTHSGERIAHFCPHGTNPSLDWGVIRAVAFSPDGSLALVGFHHRTVGVWNTVDHTLIRFLTSSQSDRLFDRSGVRDTLTTSVAVSRDHSFVFAGFADMAATIWKLEGGEVIFAAHQHVEDIINLWIEDKRARWATTSGNI